MLLLIDGYNLLHAVGWASPRMPTPQLRAARRRLLDWLAEQSTSAELCVVFDALHGKPSATEQNHRGVRVRFAVGRTADDVIEEMLADRPVDVIVVSNDGRLHEAARRRGTVGWSCPRFVDWLLDHKQSQPTALPDAPEKPDGPDADVEALLRAFSVPKFRKRR